MSLDTCHLGFIVCGIAGAAISCLCYDSYAGGPEVYRLLAITGARFGIAFWLLKMNEYLDLPKR